jgi:hypothetical protein
MGKGFVLCAVVCASLALAVYAGLYQFIGISDAAAIFLLLGICLVFHGAAIFFLRPREESGERLDVANQDNDSELEISPGQERGKSVRKKEYAGNGKING